MDSIYPLKKMGTKLNQNDINELRSQGYSDTEIQQALREIENEELKGSADQTSQRVDSRQGSRVSSFATRQNEDIIKWQLELNDILERAEHILRGDIPKFKDGNIIWEDNPQPEMNTLNEVGVQECMKILAMYVNRNTILADYDNDEINIKVFDFGRALNNLIFMRDFEFGMDTEEKRKNYEMLVSQLKDIVHSAYKRALDGAEKRSLREMINVSQSSSTSAQLGNGVTVNNQGMPVKERGILNPLRYISSKYS